MVVSVLFDIKFGYAQISVPKISTSMSTHDIDEKFCFLEKGELYFFRRH